MIYREGHGNGAGPSFFDKFKKFILIFTSNPPGYTTTRCVRTSPRNAVLYGCERPNHVVEKAGKVCGIEGKPRIPG